MEVNAVRQPSGLCLSCGCRNGGDESRCEKCGRRLGPLPGEIARLQSHGTICEPLNPKPGEMTGLAIAGAGSERLASADQQPSARPARGARSRRPGLPRHEDLRKQLRMRVQDFRTRRGNVNLVLPFQEGEGTREPEGVARKVISIGSMPASSARTPIRQETQHRTKRTPVPTQQQALDFPSASEQMESPAPVAVAPFGLRLAGHGIDCVLNLAALLLFLLPLKLWAGPVVFNRFLLMGSFCAYLVLVLLYGFLFLCLAGATPAMRWIGLRVVNFDGMPPRRRQLLCRFLGSIASVGSFFLGFIWAAIDEEELSWHDRMSKTFLTRKRE